MRSTLITCELLLLAATAATAHSLPEIPIAKKNKHAGARPVFRKRQDETLGTTVFDIITYSVGGAYYANISVGTPPQEQTVILDTGSSDLYFDASSAPACQTDGAYACKGGTFSPGDSKTYDVVKPAPAFDTRFGDGSTASGPFAEDTVCIADICISNVQFGLAQQVKSTTGFALGLLGLGYSENEATRHEYPNIPEVLVEADVIKSRLYSVYLNTVKATSGAILFGGIDTTKYSGDLVAVDILPDAVTGKIDQFISTVTALTTKVGGKTNSIWSGGSPGVDAYKNNDKALPVLLDTGSSAWSVPKNWYPYIAQQFPYVDEQGLCPCSYASSGDSLILEFAGKVKIEVPASEFIVPVYNRTTTQPYEYRNGKDQCIFMIAPSDDNGMGFYTLGDAILRSMYVVFDLDNGQLALAQSKTDSTADPDVHEVPAGPNGIAKAVSNVQTAAPQSSYPIAPQLNATADYAVTTAKTTIGAATGTGAIPDGAAPDSTKSGAASSLRVPPADWTGLWVGGIAMAMASLGAALML